MRFAAWAVGQSESSRRSGISRPVVPSDLRNLEAGFPPFFPAGVLVIADLRKLREANLQCHGMSLIPIVQPIEDLPTTHLITEASQSHSVFCREQCEVDVDGVPDSSPPRSSRHCAVLHLVADGRIVWLLLFVDLGCAGQHREIGIFAHAAFMPCWLDTAPIERFASPIVTQKAT